MAQLLLVEDDAAIRGALIRALTERGHAVWSTPTAMEALRHVVDSPPDLVILDLGLPDLDGYEALRMLRAISKVPVVVATARDDEADIVRVLDAGADDYLVKPFGIGQIEARVRAVLRRASAGEDHKAEPVVVGGLRLNGEAYEAALDGVPLDLSRREFDLLYYLAVRAGQVVTKRDLLTQVWRMPYGGADKTVDVHVSWLRRKLGENAQRPRYLHTIRGVGIKLDSAVVKLRVILLVLAISSLILVSFMLPLALLLRSFAADRAVSAAQIQVQDIATLVATLSPADLDREVAQVNAQNPVQPVTIFLPGGRQLGVHAAGSPGLALAVRGGGSFSERVPGGVAVFAAVQGLPQGTVVIRAFVPDSLLLRGVTHSWVLLGVVALGLLAMAVIVAAQLTKSLVRPLGNVASVAEQLAAGDLSARAPVDGPPEIRQVSNGLNRLAARIGELLTHERETLADLSHRLRTPLTALRIDAELLYGDEELMTRVVGDVDALTATVNEIISQARRPTADAAGATCDATAVVRERAAFWRALAEDQERWMMVELPPHSLPVLVSAQDLAACVDVLLENVFSHTQEGTAFSVRVSPRAGGGAWLAVCDSGPGFKHPDPARRGQSSGGSTGLGLDIARRIAESSGGTLTLGRSPHGGGAVTMGLGPAASGASKPRRHVRARRQLRPARAAQEARISAELSEWAVITDRDPGAYN